jgi:ribonuclease P protein component
MADQRFRAAEHLRRRDDFEATYKLRNSAADERLVVYARPNGLAFSRLGLSVSGRLGPSVARNRFRRRAREAFRLHKDELPKGFDFILIPRRHLDRTVDEIYDSLSALAAQLCG